ncbi:transposon Ty3-I Gag-Pol polyprotein [Trichonephila clavipes]|nr:transposon Ty3-I Gag-Pol polyprotein [Trichonephila clavipes]
MFLLRPYIVRLAGAHAGIFTHTSYSQSSLRRRQQSLTAKNACDSLLQIFSRTGIPSIIASDQGTNFKSALTQEFTKRIGSSPRFSCPGYPASNGLVERWNKVLKDMIHHVIREDPRSWDRQLPFLLFAYREVPNITTGVSPFFYFMAEKLEGR